MSRILLLLCSVLVISCKSVPVIKESPEVAKTAYAIKDSFANARIDLADNYTDQLIQLVTPPRDVITISPILQNGKRVAVIPSKFRDDSVIVVGTQDWNNILKIKEVVGQLANDKTNLNAQLLKVQDEIRSQQELKEQLAADNLILTSELKDYKFALYKRTAYLIALLTLVAGYIYIRACGMPASILTIASKIPFVGKFI